jgi:hypothetical protein
MGQYFKITKGYNGGWSADSTDLKYQSTSPSGSNWINPHNAYYYNSGNWTQFYGTPINLATTYNLDKSENTNGPVFTYIVFGNNFSIGSDPNSSFADWLADTSDNINFYEMYVHRVSGDVFNYTVFTSYDTWISLGSIYQLGYTVSAGSAAKSGVFTISIRNVYGSAFSDTTTLNISCTNTWTGGK